MSEEIEYQPIEDSVTTYELGTPIAEGTSAAIEVFKCKDGERILLGGVIMINGSVNSTVVGHDLYDTKEEFALLHEKITEAISMMGDFYAGLPEDVRATLEEEQDAKANERQEDEI